MATETKLIVLLLLALNYHECLGKLLTEKFSSCPSKVYNNDLHADNAVEIDVDPNVVREIFSDYKDDIKPYLNTSKSTEDFCLVTPYNPETRTWQTNDDKVRSDMKWYSVKNFKTYERYRRHVERLDIKKLFKGTWIDDDITIYSMFFLVRSHCEEHHMHVDWSGGVHTQVVTVLIPLKDFGINLAYKDVDDNVQHYDYKFGKAIGVSGGFLHSTDIGHSDPEDVLLCIYLGSSDPTIWEYAQDAIADELQYYMSPFDGFVRNQEFPRKRICQ